MKRRTVAELVRDTEMRILQNKQMKEEYEKRLTMLKQNVNFWKKRFELNVNYNQNIIPRIEKNKKEIDVNFIDVICTNCYAMIKIEEMDEHSLHCAISKNANNCFSSSISFDECNHRMYKMYSALKEKSNEIYATNNSTMIKYYNALLNLTYEIILNNNSYDDLKNYQKNLSMLVDFKFDSSQKIQAMLNIFCLRLEQLTDIKAKTMMSQSTKENFEESLKMNRLSEVNSEVNNKENDFTLFTNDSVRKSQISQIFPFRKSNLYQNLNQRKTTNVKSKFHIDHYKLDNQ